MKQWKEERCSMQPNELEVIADGMLMQRRNVRAVFHESMGEREAFTDYMCESREITVSEYEMLNRIDDINTDKAIDAYTQQLIEEGLI